MPTGLLSLALVLFLVVCTSFVNQAETKSIIVPVKDDEPLVLSSAESTKEEKASAKSKLGPIKGEDNQIDSAINLRGSAADPGQDPLTGEEATISEPEPAPLPKAKLPKVGRKSKEAFTNSLQSCPDTTRIVFLGDTTFAKMRQQPQAMDALKDYGTANIAIEGYQVEMMDEFILRTNLYNLAQASLVVIMIGAENIAKLEKSEFVFEKMVAFVETVRQKFDAGTKIVILSILPRDSSGLNRAIEVVNSRLGNKYKAYSMVKVLDVSSQFLLKTGRLDASLYAANLYHINTAGYLTIMQKLMTVLRDVPKLDAGSSSICDLSILDTFGVVSGSSIGTPRPSVAPSYAPVPLPTNEPIVSPTPVPSNYHLTSRDNPGRPDSTTVTPVPHKRHAEFEPEIIVELARYNANTRIILYGDSVFYKVGISNILGDYNAVNLASPGFFIENLLHRMGDPGQSQLKDVPVVAIMIGGFNVGARDCPEAVANGLKAIVKLAKSKFSESTKIVLFSILPRNSKLLNTDIFEINHALSYFADQPDLDFYFVDVTNRFWDAKSGALVNNMFEADKFTLSTDGLALLKKLLDQIINQPVEKPAVLESPVSTISSNVSNVPPPALTPDNPVVTISTENQNTKGITIELAPAVPGATNDVKKEHAIATEGSELHGELHETPPVKLRHAEEPPQKSPVDSSYEYFKSFFLNINTNPKLANEIKSAIPRLISPDEKPVPHDEVVDAGKDTQKKTLTSEQRDFRTKVFFWDIVFASLKLSL